MGDSGIAFQLSLLAALLVGTGVVAFVAACLVRSRAVRVVAGVFLLAIAAFSGILSTMGAALLGVLGVLALALAVKTPRGQGLRSESDQIQK
ncbi:MAG: hypothetical protein HY892_04685 [Deltaproteobacteria bacterium]|nr:hypothetical protein [Deltaproteobacteria bacterium]